MIFYNGADLWYSFLSSRLACIYDFPSTIKAVEKVYICGQGWVDDHMAGLYLPCFPKVINVISGGQWMRNRQMFVPSPRLV